MPPLLSKTPQQPSNSEVPTSILSSKRKGTAPPSQKDEWVVPLGLEKYKLAVNLCDITDDSRILPIIRSMLFSGKLDLSKPVVMDNNRVDESGVVFSCDLLTAACICDTLRSHDRNNKDYPTRLYIFRGKAWSKLPGDVVLTEVVDGKPIQLSSEVFAIEAEVLQPVPMKCERLF